MANLPAARTQLSVKLALLVVAIFGFALAALLLVQRAQRHSLAALLESETQERSAMMARVADLTAQALRDFTLDYALWDDMVTFVAAPRRDWAAINLDASLKSFSLAAIWVLRVDGSIVYATQSEDSREPPPAFPLSEGELQRVLGGRAPRSFFVPRPGDLLELCFAPVLPSDDVNRAGQPHGWLVGARRWDDAQVRLIGSVMQCETAVVPRVHLLPPSQPNRISLHYPLAGIDGTPVANLLYTLRSHELEIVARGQRTQLGLFAAAFLLTAIVAVAFVYGVIVRPLNVLGESLATHDARTLLPLLARRDEVGRVAQAVKTSFEQHAELEGLMVERTRLGRELHDGVIQTVYAAGMNLAGARALLRVNPTEAERILEDTRAELNASIRSLRDFIHGLEPEPLQARPFREAVQSIVTLMQGVRPVTSTLQIDDALAQSLTDHQRLHLLQIAREAVSNSVRHGQARHLLIRLERELVGIVFAITDDGIGWDGVPSADGRGLGNFTARARELGGEIDVASIPGTGLRVRLVIPG